MKKYKLLQNYISPVKTIHSGAIKSEDEWINEFELNKGDCVIKTDWFKEVIEKDYEILEFKADLSDSEEGLVFKLVSKNKYITEKRKSTYCFEVFREINNVQITKVKRLFDGEVFEVGDIIENINISSNNVYKIERFINEEYFMRVEGILGIKGFCGWSYSLNNIGRVIKPKVEHPSNILNTSILQNRLKIVQELLDEKKDKNWTDEDMMKFILYCVGLSFKNNEKLSFVTDFKEKLKSFKDNIGKSKL